MPDESPRHESPPSLRQRSKSLREFGWLSGANQLGALTSILAVVVLTHVDSIGAVGQAFFAQAFAGVVMIVFDIRFEDAIQRFAPQQRANGARDQFIWKLIRFDVGFGALLILVTLILMSLDAIPSGDVVNPQFVVLGLLAAAAATSVGSLNAGFAVSKQFATLARFQALSTTANSVLMIIGALVAGATGFLVGSLVGSVVQVLLLGLRLTLIIGYERNSRDVVTPPGFLRFLAKSSLATSAAIGSESGVLSLVGVVAGPQAVAFLKVALAPYRVVASIYSPVAVQAFPRFAEQAAAGNEQIMAREALGLSKIIAIVNVPATMIGGLIMPRAISVVFGEAYDDAALAASILLGSAAIRAVVVWSKVLPLAIGRPGLRLTVILTEAVFLCLAATVGALLGPTDVFTVDAVAVSNLVAACLLLIGWLLFVKRMERTHVVAI